MVGLRGRVVKVNPKVGLIVIHVERIKRLVETSVNLVVEKRVRRELSIQRVDQHHQLVKQRVKVKVGVKKVKRKVLMKMLIKRLLIDFYLILVCLPHLT